MTLAGCIGRSNPGPIASATTGQESTPYPAPNTVSPSTETSQASSTLGVEQTPNPYPGITQSLPERGTPTDRPFSTAEPPPNSIAQTISIWHSWDASQTQTLQYLLSLFQDTYPNVYFDVLYVPFDELQARYEAAAYRGDGPELVLGPAEWGASFYDKGLTVDLSLIAGQEFLAEINPAALGEVKYRDALIGLPYAIRKGSLLFRNKSILPKAPQTFDDLIDASKAATRGGKVGAYLERGFYHSTSHLYGIGGSLMNEDGYPTFNDESGVEWLNLLKSFDDGGPTEFNGDRDLELFKAGKVGTIIEGSWNLKDIAEAIGKDNLAIDPWPSYGKGGLSGYVQTDNIYLNSNIPEDERFTPLQFMAFFLAREVQAILAQDGRIPVVRNVQVDDPLIQQAVTAFEKGTPYPISPETNLYWGPLEEAMRSVFEGEATPEEALKSAYDTIIAELGQ